MTKCFRASAGGRPLRPTGWLREGFIVGASATAAEALSSRAQPRLLGGRRPVIDATAMASALLERLKGNRPSDRLARLWGDAMRCAYGPTWAIAWISVQPRTRAQPRARSAVLLAVTIWVAEMVMLPGAGATPPLREWPGVDIALDLSNALTYAAVAWVALALLRRMEA